jgi:hypothetical protein
LIFECCLPRSLNVFEGCLKGCPTSEINYLDLGVYGDLDHMPVALKITVLKNMRVMYGYCELFGTIRSCLADNMAPTPDLIWERVFCSSACNAKAFLSQNGADTRHALEYLIVTLKEVMSRNIGRKDFADGLDLLPLCHNDNRYWLLKESLLKAN